MYATDIPINIRLRPRRLADSIPHRLFALANKFEEMIDPITYLIAYRAPIRIQFKVLNILHSDSDTP